MVVDQYFRQFVEMEVVEEGIIQMFVEMEVEGVIQYCFQFVVMEEVEVSQYFPLFAEMVV